MPVCTRLGVAILFGVTTFAAPGFAASDTTDAFAANIRLNAAYLAISSRLATANAQSDAIKQFAGAELAHQTDVLALLDGWQARDANRTKVASNALEEGRSVAADNGADVATFAPADGSGALMPAAAMSLEHVSTMNGAAFDALYKSMDTNALTHLAGFYEAYARTGDNAALRELARSELVRVRASLEVLAKI